jgi:hypothetical protein
MGVGLAIGTDAMRACAVAPRWPALRLRWCGLARLPRELIRPSPREENIASVAGFRRQVRTAVGGLWGWRRMRVGLPDRAARVRVVFTDELPPDPAACRTYLLWRLADALDCRPEDSRLAYMALPNPLPGPRLAVTCAVTGAPVARQYERALTESRIQYSGISPSSVLLFNFFQPHIMVPTGVPILILAATDETLTTVLALDGCPVFWRTRALAPLAVPGGGWANGRRGDLVRDLTEAVEYGEATLGMDPPGHVWVTGPPTEVPGLARWLAAQVGLPTTCLEPRTLLRRAPRPLAGDGWHRWGPALGAATRS